MNTPRDQTRAPFIIFSCVLATIIIVGGIISFVQPTLRTYGRAQQTSQKQSSVTFQKEIVPRDQILSRANNAEFAYAKGPQDAAVTVVEYFDFLCPFSAQSAQSAQKLLKKYEQAPVRFIFRQVPAAQIYPASLPASNASLCANEQGKFLPMYSLLFDQQKKIRSDDFSFFSDTLRLDRGAFDACMSQRKYQKWISKDLSDAVALKLQGTPTWFVNGKRFIGAMPFDVLSDAIDKEIETAQSGT